MGGDWRTGTIELVDGYHLTDGAGRSQQRLEGVRFTVEGGYVTVEVPGAEFPQMVSAPAVRRIVVTG